MRVLSSDAIIASMKLEELVDVKQSEARHDIRSIFDTASSGHKIVLLTLTRLVELVDQRTLVVIDEPEAHLHPPLQSAFVRALSELLTERNAVALLATHSPVMLQEIPKECVWLLFRSGDFPESERPQIETFGENVGVLTSEVFRLEVSESGFHTLLRRATERADTFEAVLNSFGNHLGAEGRAVARAMWRSRDNA